MARGKLAEISSWPWLGGAEGGGTEAEAKKTSHQPGRTRPAEELHKMVRLKELLKKNLLKFLK